VGDRAWFKSHQPRAGRIGGDGIVCKHNLAQTPRSSIERTVAFHCYNAIRNHEMDRNGCTEIQDALLSLSCVGGVQVLRVDPKCWQRLRKEAPVTFSAGIENPALQPDILIMSFVRELLLTLSVPSATGNVLKERQNGSRPDAKGRNEHSSTFSMENTTGGARVPGPFVRHRVLAGAGR
jgi:hypothetical protein